jgi:cyclophilin family peptidyl-prolyl cis-trans isomerase
MKNSHILILVIIFILMVGGLIFIIRQTNKSDDSITTQSANKQPVVLEKINTNQVNQPTTQKNMEQTTSTVATTTVVENFSHEVTIQTNMGEIVFLTYDMDAPNTVNNFITLVEKNYYDGIIFHRVIDKFMIQGGDPTGTGTGGPGYSFADELNPETESYQVGYATGTVAMANSGPNTNGSQFFIMVADYPLPNKYTIFGKVIKGQEIANAIAQVPKDANDKPLQDVVMEKVTIKTIETK